MTAGTKTRPARRTRSAARPLRIGLMGLGTVGGGLHQLVRRKRRELAARCGLLPEITRILVRDPDRERIAAVTTDVDAFCAGRYDCVVEAMGGLAPAGRLVRHFLRRGVPVVTANKALLAERGDELRTLAAGRGVALRGEAAVGGAIPLLGTLERSLRAVTVERVAAVLNGTCNFVLTRMARDGLALGAAVEEARRLGFAEADPSLDLSGVDAAQKLAILVDRLGGPRLALEAIEVNGLAEVRPGDCARAALLGYRFRPVAVASLGAEPGAFVGPTLVGPRSPFFGVEDESNAVCLHTDTAGELVFGGPGAGALPTASAILDDVVAVATEPAPPAAPAALPAAPARACSTPWFLSVRFAAEAAGPDAALDLVAGPGLRVRELKLVRECGLPTLVAITAPAAPDRVQACLELLRTLRSVAEVRAFRLLD